MNNLAHAPVRSRALVAVAVGALGTAGLGLLTGAWMNAGPAYLPTSLGLFGIVAMVIVGFAGAHHPFPRFGPANQVTLARVVLIAIVGGLIVEPRSERAEWLAVGATALAAILDGLDGWLARWSRLSSAFGARFDLEADALLILVLSVLVWQHGKAGAWVLACGLMRYVFLGATGLVRWMDRPLRSTVRGKTVAIGQLVGLAAALSPLVPFPPSAAIAGITLAALAWSFALDVRWLYRGRRSGATT